MVSAMNFNNLVLHLKVNLIYCSLYLAVQGPIRKKKPLVGFDVQKAEG